MSRESSQYRRVLGMAQRAGWRIERTGSGHIRMLDPTGRYIVITASTPSDRRAFQNFLSDLRRAGFNPGRER